MDSPPKILLTTSRNPTPKMRTFCRDLTRVIPGTVHVARGKMSMDEVAEKALENRADRVIIVDRWQGGPGKIEFYRIGSSGLIHVTPGLYVSGIRLQRDFAPAKLKPPSSLFITQSINNFVEIANFLSEFLDAPILPRNEGLSKQRVMMHISQDAKNRVQITFMQPAQKVEIGPRITLQTHSVGNVK